MNSVEVEHYPFKLEENESVIHNGVLSQIEKLASCDVFPETEREEVVKYLYLHFLRSRFLFLDEEQLRGMGFSNANLFYHGAPHAVFQATYDALCVTRAILSRKDRFSSHLTPESAFAIPSAAVYHDTGFAYQKHVLVNCAGMSPVHVEESKRSAVESIDLLGLPNFLDPEKTKKLVEIGIHGSYFPYDSQRQKEGEDLMRDLPPELKKEAQIVRLAVQFADLGGQSARIDQFPEGLKNLRKELNCIRDGLGTQVIGEDDELDQKRQDFINFVVEKTVGKTGNAFFGTRDHSFSREWHRASVSSR